MALITAPVEAAGVVTLPTLLPLVLPTADSTRWDPVLPSSTCRLPDGNGLFRVNGRDRPQHIFGDTIYQTGILAPIAAPTATPTGARATASFDLDVNDDGVYDPVSGTDTIRLLNRDGRIFAIAALGTPGLYAQVLSSTGEEFLDSLQDLVNNTNEGITWEHGTLGVAQNAVAAIQSTIEVASHLTAWELVLRAKEYGSSGNSFEAFFYVGWGGAADIAIGSSNQGNVGTVFNFTGGGAGSGTAPSAGDYRYFYTYIRTADGAESGPSPEATASQGIAMNIDLASLDDPVPADASVDYIRIYRTEDSGDQFFWLADKAVGGDGPYTDSTPDGLEEGSLQFAGPTGQPTTPFDENIHRTYKSGLPPVGRACMMWKGRLWQGGAVLSEDYSAGDAAVTLDSAAVTLQNGAVPTKEMEGNYFTVASHSEQYLIINVAEDTGVLTLARKYKGASTDPATYTIKDLRDPNQIYCTEAQKTNLWPETNNPGQVDPRDDDEGIVGMHAGTDAGMVWSHSSMVRVTGNGPNSWQVHRVIGGRGAVSDKAISEVDEGFVWLGTDLNLYASPGVGTPQSLSHPRSPPGQVPTGLRETMKRINQVAAHLTTMHYCDQSKHLRVNVPLDTSVVPNYAIVLDMNKPGDFYLDTIPDITAMGRVRDVNGSPICIGGDQIGQIFQYDVGSGTTDGLFGVEPVQAIAAGATVRSLDAKTGTPWSGLTLDGLPALFIDRSAQTYELTKIASNDGDTLTLARDLSAAPAVDDQILVGCFAWVWKGGRAVAGEGWTKTTVKDVGFLLEVGTKGVIHAAFAKDNNTPTVPTEGDYVQIDMTTADGRVILKSQHRGVPHQMQLTGLTPTDGAIVGFIPNVAGEDVVAVWTIPGPSFDNNETVIKSATISTETLRTRNQTSKHKIELCIRRGAYISPIGEYDQGKYNLAKGTGRVILNSNAKNLALKKGQQLVARITKTGAPDPLLGTTITCRLGLGSALEVSSDIADDATREAIDSMTEQANQVLNEWDEPIVLQDQAQTAQTATAVVATGTDSDTNLTSATYVQVGSDFTITLNELLTYNIYVAVQLNGTYDTATSLSQWKITDEASGSSAFEPFMHIVATSHVAYVTIMHVEEGVTGDATRTYQLHGLRTSGTGQIDSEFGYQIVAVPQSPVVEVS